MKRLLLILILLTGCSTMLYTNGVPNLSKVDYTVYRGGQPTKEGWDYLYNVLHITNVVKLNTIEEGSDKYAESLGMKVNYYPISLQEQIFSKPYKSTVWNAVDSIREYTYIHSEHGQDRTGLIVACYRINNGSSKKLAGQEMLKLGFHNTEFGLKRFWENQTDWFGNK